MNKEHFVFVEQELVSGFSQTLCCTQNLLSSAHNWELTNDYSSWTLKCECKKVISL